MFWRDRDVAPGEQIYSPGDDAELGQHHAAVGAPSHVQA